MYNFNFDGLNHYQLSTMTQRTIKVIINAQNNMCV
jgi:hypothetical protein